MELHYEISPTESLEQVLAQFKFSALKGTNQGKLNYYNIPCAFDIETTSFYYDIDNGNNYNETERDNYIDECKRKGKDYNLEKRAIMYIWQLGINGHVFIGRTWIEFINIIERIIKYLGLKENKRLIIYVHNLSYEMGFIEKLFPWDKTFNIDFRKPIYAIYHGIEFRCSYLLSGKKLADLPESLLKYKVSKLVGDLDYSKIRNSQTILSGKELQYCINDVLVVMAYIQEEIERNKNITHIPLTKTGYVRKYVKSNCFKDSTYKRFISTLRIKDISEYKTLKSAFQGGFTHSNPLHTGSVINDVSSMDFTSSYPAVMCSELFPMTSGKRITLTNKSDLDYFLEKYCCVFSIEFKNIRATVLYENPISSSRCIILDKADINNGRVVSAELLVTTITNVDFEIIKKFYTWDTFRIADFIYYGKGYLPKPFIQSILELYKDKTTLKGVNGREIDYMLSKAMLNACYGMTVTDTLKPDILLDNTRITDLWYSVPKDEIKGIDDYNTSKSRFLFYPWGIFVTAYARKNLFTGIVECKNDYIYSDTDSIKIINIDRHKEYFDKYNQYITYKLKLMCSNMGIHQSYINPQTIEGIYKPLGVWDDDGYYTKFKTLGAKRYLVEHNGKLKMTVAGLNKQNAIEYLSQGRTNDDVFNLFNDALYIPKDKTGKMTHSYFDIGIEGDVLDYQGHLAHYKELSFIHLAQQDYNLSMAQTYINYLKRVQTVNDMNLSLSDVAVE